MTFNIHLVVLSHVNDILDCLGLFAVKLNFEDLKCLLKTLKYLEFDERI